LTEPNTDLSLRPEIALLFNNHRELYNSTAFEWTQKYAKDNNDNL
jgi:ubiquitin-protein ligase